MTADILTIVLWHQPTMNNILTFVIRERDKKLTSFSNARCSNMDQYKSFVQHEITQFYDISMRLHMDVEIVFAPRYVNKAETNQSICWGSSRHVYLLKKFTSR